MFIHWTSLSQTSVLSLKLNVWHILSVNYRWSGVLGKFSLCVFESLLYNTCIGMQNIWQVTHRTQHGKWDHKIKSRPLTLYYTTELFSLVQPDSNLPCPGNHISKDCLKVLIHAELFFPRRDNSGNLFAFTVFTLQTKFHCCCYFWSDSSDYLYKLKAQKENWYK